MPIAIPLAVAGASAAGYAGLTAAGVLGTTALDAGLGAGLTGDLAAEAGVSSLTAGLDTSIATSTITGGMTGLQELSLGSSLLSGAGQLFSGMATGKADKYNAEIAANNANIAHQNATATIQEGEANAAAASMGTKAKIGGILANQGASGVDVNSGSSLDVRSSAAQNGELNAINIRSQATRRAYGLETDATSATAESNMYKSESSTAELAGGISGAGTLLSGAANPITSPWSDFLTNKSLS